MAKLAVFGLAASGVSALPSAQAQALPAPKVRAPRLAAPSRPTTVAHPAPPGSQSPGSVNGPGTIGFRSPLPPGAPPIFSPVSWQYAPIPSDVPAAANSAQLADNMAFMAGSGPWTGKGLGD